MSFKKPKAIFFDWDGTLVDSYSFLSEAHSHVRKAFGMAPFKEGEYMLHFGKPRDVLYPLIYGEENVEEAKEKFGAYVVNNRSKLKPLDGAPEMLKALHEAGFILGAVSNKKSDYLHGEAEAFGWADYFSAIIGAGDAKHDKPHGDPLLLAIERAGVSDVPLDEILMVGDTAFDLGCAAHVGCPAALVRYGMNIDDLITEYKPLLVVEDCRALQEKLLQCV